MRTILLLLTMTLACHAAAAATGQERRDQLTAVQILLRDPDPMMRLANMEELLGSGDTLRIQLALRTAFSSDDAALRGLAMRAYIANLKRVTFDVQPTDAAAKAFAAANDESAPLADAFKRYPFLRNLAGVGFQFVLAFKDYDVRSDTGMVSAANTAPFTLTGDRFTTQVALPFWDGNFPCSLDLRPSPTLRLEGYMSCVANPMWPRLRVSTPLF